MSDSTRRGLRTAFQLVLTLLTTAGTVGVLRGLGVDVSDEQWAGLSAVALPFMTTLINALEDSGRVPAVLKAPASGGAEPFPDPELEHAEEA